MKTRILSGVGVVVFLIAMLLCTYTPFFSLFLALLSGVAVFEIERVAQVKNKAIMGISVAFSALLPVLISAGVNLPVPLVAIGYTILLLILMLAQYEITRFEHVAIALFVSLGIPLAFSCMIFFAGYLYGLPAGVFKGGRPAIRVVRHQQRMGHGYVCLFYRQQVWQA